MSIIEKIIHEAETYGSKGYFICPNNLKKILESSGLRFILVDEKKYDCGQYPEEREVHALYHIQGTTLRYFFSPGLGSFPNRREKITAYGSEEDISNLEDKLALKAGTPK